MYIHHHVHEVLLQAYKHVLGHSSLLHEVHDYEYIKCLIYIELYMSVHVCA